MNAARHVLPLGAHCGVHVNPDSLFLGMPALPATLSIVGCVGPAPSPMPCDRLTEHADVTCRSMHSGMTFGWPLWLACRQPLTMVIRTMLDAVSAIESRNRQTDRNRLESDHFSRERCARTRHSCGLVSGSEQHVMADDLSGDNAGLLIAADYLAKSLIVRPRLAFSPLPSSPFPSPPVSFPPLASPPFAPPPHLPSAYTHRRPRQAPIGARWGAHLPLLFIIIIIIAIPSEYPDCAFGASCEAPCRMHVPLPADSSWCLLDATYTCTRYRPPCNVACSCPSSRRGTSHRG
jgi:hypothetical protein